MRAPRGRFEKMNYLHKYLINLHGNESAHVSIHLSHKSLIIFKENECRQIFYTIFFFPSFYHFQSYYFLLCNTSLLLVVVFFKHNFIFHFWDPFTHQIVVKMNHCIVNVTTIVLQFKKHTFMQYFSKILTSKNYFPTRSEWNVEENLVTNTVCEYICISKKSMMIYQYCQIWNYFFSCQCRTIGHKCNQNWFYY